jgi:hypothetical protein
VELLGDIIDLLRPLDIARLWECGNYSLKMKLSARGVVKKFDHKIELGMPVSWPWLIAYMPHVTEFSLSSSLNTLELRLSRVEMQTLPARLKKLAVSFRGAHTWFDEHFCDEKDRFSELEEIVVNRNYNERLFERTKLEDLPKGLLLLDLGLVSSIPVRLTTLPPGLTHLQAPITTLVNVTLPSTLTLLSIILSDSLSDWISTPFPDSLTDITVLFRSIFIQPKSYTLSWRALPRGLIRLKTEVREKLSAEAAADLPRGLTHLHLNNCIPLSTLPLLPRTLKYINGLTNDIIRGDVALGLPPGTISIDATVAPTAIPYLPQTMARLRIASASINTLTNWDPLPTSLTELSLSEFPPPLGQFLPPTLRILKIIHLAVTRDSMEAIPRCVEILFLPGVSEDENEHPFLFLPPSLTSLTSDCDRMLLNIPPETHKWLSPSLTALRLDQKCKTPEKFFAYVGKSLTSLILNTFLFTVTDAQDLMLGAPQLETLQVHLWNDQKRASRDLLNSLAFLPKQLQSLYLSFHYGNLLRSSHISAVSYLRHLCIFARRITHLSTSENFVSVVTGSRLLSFNLNGATPDWFKR